MNLTKAEQMQELLEKRNGYLLSQDVIESGISKTYMSEFVKKYDLERVAQGVYMSADTWQDDLYILCLKNAKAILSYETALHVHELTERDPGQYGGQSYRICFEKYLSDLYAFFLCIQKSFFKKICFERSIFKVKTAFQNRVTRHCLDNFPRHFC